jgi:hypothetical protein
VEGIGLFYRVKYLQALCIVICCFVLPADAQNENWDTYMVRLGDKPASILVDMGLLSSAPDKRYPYLVITGPKVKTCNTKGLPEKDEIDKLEQILGETGNFLTGVTAKVLAGTLTCNCERVNYYYVKDTPGIRSALARMYNRNFSDYSYVTRIKADPEWGVYRTFLYPDEETLNWMQNDKVIMQLLQQGDSLSTERNINFELYFRTDSARSNFAGFARAKGYKADKFLTAKNTVAPYELIISKFAAVKMDSINVMTKELKEEMKRRNGFYNGWGSDVVKQPHR